jgi:hypothetical protein
MPEFQIPCFPVSERTTWCDLPEVIDAFVEIVDEKTGSCPPLLIFEPHPDFKIPGRWPVISEAPEELLVIAILPDVRTACFQALERVEAREPKPLNDQPRKSLKFKDNTPLKSFFRQMAQMPATVVSLTFPDDGPDAVSIFFLRTPFTISEFRREMHQVIE